MFSSINFLFLTSLAITSWVVLCYLKHIEDQRLQELNVDFSMDSVFDETTLRNSTIPCRGEGYEIYLNLLCVFACIYALAKITSLTENYIIRHVQAKIPHQYQYQQQQQQRQQQPPPPRMPRPKAAPKAASTPQEPPAPLQERIMLQMTFQEQQPQLQPCELCQSGCSRRNSCTKFVLINAEETAAAAVAAAEAAVTAAAVSAAAAAVKQQQQRQQQQQPNIFISNRHFHLNQGQIYVNEGNMRLNFQNFHKDVGDGGGGVGGGGGGGQNATHTASSGDFSQIWQKYLEMQKYAIKKPSAPFESPAQMANNVPLVVSTEDLMRGLL